MNIIFSNKKGVIAGGDMRQVHLANLLSYQMEVFALALEDPEPENSILLPSVKKINQIEEIPKDFDYLILPMPAANGAYINTPLTKTPIHIGTLFRQIPSNVLVMAGKIGPELHQEIDSCGLKSIDYLEREELAILNAVATAEGTLELLLSELPVTVFGLKALIIGGGRISRALRTRLKALGAQVSVSARKHADLAWASADGCNTIPIGQLPDTIQQFDAIINTVPAKILHQDILKQISRQTLIIDLASKPGGVDFDEANRLGLKTIWALSLPGKTAPISSGEIIFRTIQHIIEEEEQHGET